jgi:hypothetical protein
MTETQDTSQPPFQTRLNHFCSELRRTVLRIAPTWLLVGLGFLLALAFLILLCFVLDVGAGVGAWRGWTMVESLGTVLAVFSAIGLAWWEGSRQRREGDQQRRFVRVLLSQEIRANARELDNVEQVIFEQVPVLAQLTSEDDATLWRTVTTQPPPDAPPLLLHKTIKSQLEEQLSVSSQTLTASEITQINSFYSSLSTLWATLREYSQHVTSDALITVREVKAAHAALIRMIDHLACPIQAIHLVKLLESDLGNTDDSLSGQATTAEGRHA